MKRIKRFIQFILCLMMIAPLSACQNSSINIIEEINKHQTIVWGIDVESGVFGHIDIEKNEIVGFDADIARAVTKKILGKDAEPTFVEVAGKTRVPMLKTHVVDAIAATLTITEARKEVIDFSDSYFTAGQALLVKKGSPITSLDDMTEANVLIMVKGTTSAAAVAENNPRVKTIEFESYAEAFVALKSGQGDAMTTDNAILFNFAVEDPNYIVLPELFTIEYYGLGVDSGQPELLAAINKALTEMQASGEYQEIYQKWIPEG